MTQFTDLGVKAIRDGVAAGAFRAREVAEAFNTAVADAAALNAFIVTTPEHALAAADQVDEERAAGRPPGRMAGERKRAEWGTSGSVRGVSGCERISK